MNQLTLPLAAAFLFAGGCVIGWILEFFFRNLISHKGPKGRYFINPGFCKGPWLPIYGIGLTVMCQIAYFVGENMDPVFLESFWGKLVVILFLGLAMITIEFIGGLFLLKVLNMRLWDYRDEPGNFMGIVCPTFSLIWTGIGALYYLLIHEVAMEKILWFSQNLAFSFFVGLFFGLFIIDLIQSAEQASMIKKFAAEHDVIVKYEELKALVQQRLMELDEKQHFFNQTTIQGVKVQEHLEQNKELLEEKAEAFKSHAKEARARRKQEREERKNRKN